jgi:F420-0:gamma-glutamyl ligase
VDTVEFDFDNSSNNLLSILTKQLACSWLKVMWVDKNNNMLKERGVVTIAEGINALVSLRVNPADGDLYYITY